MLGTVMNNLADAAKRPELCRSCALGTKYYKSAHTAEASMEFSDNIGNKSLNYEVRKWAYPLSERMIHYTQNDWRMALRTCSMECNKLCTNDLLVFFFCFFF